MTGTSLVVQWLRLCASNAGGVGLIPGWGAKLSHTVRCGKKKQNKKNWGWSKNQSRETSLEVLDAVWGSRSKSVILSLSSKETIFSALYWSIVDLQSCVSLGYIAKWFSYIYIYTYICICIFFAGAFSLIVKVKVAQLCPTLCYPMYYSPPGSSIHGTLQARILEWVAISFSRGSSSPRDQTQVSHIAGGFFTVWATREALLPYRLLQNTD